MIWAELAVTDDEVFQELRPEMFGLAYRIFGTVADAEDVLHDAYLRWRAEPRDDPGDDANGFQGRQRGNEHVTNHYACGSCSAGERARMASCLPQQARR